MQIQPWPGLLPHPKDPEGASLYWAWGTREDPAPASPVVTHDPSHQPGPLRALVLGQPARAREPQGGSGHVPQSDFLSQMPRALGLSSLGLEGMLEGGGISYLISNQHPSPQPPSHHHHQYRHHHQYHPHHHCQHQSRFHRHLHQHHHSCHQHHHPYHHHPYYHNTITITTLPNTLPASPSLPPPLGIHNTVPVITDC